MRRCLAFAGVLVFTSVGNARDNGDGTDSFVVFDDADCAGTAIDVVPTIEEARDLERARSVKQVGSSECSTLNPDPESGGQSPEEESSAPETG